MLFDPASVECTEFDIDRSRKEDVFCQIAVSLSVRETLCEMLRKTLKVLGDPNDWHQFDCAEQYPATVSLRLLLSDALITKLANLFSARNLDYDTGALKKASEIDYYFARFKDASGQECIGVRRASQFKGPVGKSLMFWLEDELTMVKGDIFRLDLDFDFIIFSDYVVIYRPGQFERIAELEAELQRIAPTHVDALALALPEIDFTFAYALVDKSARARRVISGLKSQKDFGKISLDLLEKQCKIQGIPIVEANGKWVPAPAHGLSFLSILDRRRYIDPLVDLDPDVFEASARKAVGRNPTN